METAAIIALMQWVAPFVVEKGPRFIADITAIFNTPKPTAADWESLKKKYAQPEPDQPRG
jgi:hypothetical protein